MNDNQSKLGSRQTFLIAVADHAHALANDSEPAPDYRWMDQYIDRAATKGDEA